MDEKKGKENGKPLKRQRLILPNSDDDDSDWRFRRFYNYFSTVNSLSLSLSLSCHYHVTAMSILKWFKLIDKLLDGEDESTIPRIVTDTRVRTILLELGRGIRRRSTWWPFSTNGSKLEWAFRYWSIRHFGWLSC